MITYHRHTGKRTVKAAQSALAARLYVRNYGRRSLMKQWLNDISDGEALGYTIVVAYDGSTPIGCVISDESCLIAYVKVSHRRMGIGRKMCETMRIGNEKFWVYGTTTGKPFWSKLMKKYKALDWY